MPGGYQVLRLLSQSPHGRLYAARAPSGGEVALKELVFALVPEARQLESFEREARLLREVVHPRIPRFVDFFQEGRGAHTRLYLAQELVQGTSLRELLRERHLREEEAVEVARQVLDTLRYLHELSPRIVHRDVKPANLVRREDGAVFLVDFGAARELLGSGTAGATLVGTFGYMPPEQLGGTLDASCDLYALGASLLHLLTGRSPDEMLASDLSLDVATHAFLSPRMERFLRKLVARNPAERFRSALDARLALESSSGDNRTPPVWRRAAVAVLALGMGMGASAWGWRYFTQAPASVPPPGVPSVAATLVPSPAPPVNPEAKPAGAAFAPVPPSASGDGPKPPIFSEDFSRGLRRWSRQPFPVTVRHEYEIVELEGNPVLRLFHQAPQGEVGAFLSVIPRRHDVSSAGHALLEVDVKLTRLEAAREKPGGTREDSRGKGAGLLLQVLFSGGANGRPRIVLVDLGSRVGRSAFMNESGNTVYPQPVRPGQHVHVRVALYPILAPWRSVHVERIGLLAYGANVEAFVDNLSLVEE